ncbi:MAG: NAD(+)/NADH kinase [Clostridia bacterium]|nr:NAD(+)/NADH kinase [Clostridia bacterium]
MSLMKIAVIPNTGKEGAESLAETIIGEFPENCFLVKGYKCGEKFDVALVLGGDGTILRAVKAFGEVPVLGINFGAVGYMTASEKDGAKEAVKKLLSGSYNVEERMMLSVTVKRNGKVISESTALNDGVITRSERILSLSESFNDKLVYSFSGDGIIVATPTGSTAYSLSAGGPVAPPDMQMIITTPVCPHSIHIRPVIASGDTVVKVKLSDTEENSGMLNVDGQNITPLTCGDEVIFARSEKKAKLIFLEEKNFYDILRFKLSGEKGER